MVKLAAAFLFFVASANALEARAELPPSLNPGFQFLPGNAFHSPERGDSSGGGTSRRREEKGEILTISLSLLLGVPLLVLVVGFIEDREKR
jgi:hypothetical protein